MLTGREADASTRSRRRSTTPSRRRNARRMFEAALAGARQRLPGRGTAARALRRVPQPVRHSARAARRDVQGGDRRLPQPHARSTSRCRRARASPSSTSPNKSWSGYNWYQGHYQSLIQVNTDLPIYVDRAIDLACHEGYPGHHVYNVLLEKNLVRDRGWVEFSVYPLFSPQSLIAEGTANFGIDVAFPEPERLGVRAQRRSFRRPASTRRGAADYYEVLALVDRLSYAGNEAARRYLDGEIDAKAAAAWLETLRAVLAAARGAARALHRPVPQLRDQLQPRQGHGGALRRGAGRHAVPTPARRWRASSSELTLVAAAAVWPDDSQCPTLK